MDFPRFNKIKYLVFDFDGIFTNNKVYLNEDGIESIKCDRSDGLAFDIFRKFAKKNLWDVNIFVLTKEKNKVVNERCKKLGLECNSGIDNKKQFLLDKFSNNLDLEKNVISGLAYLGNDLNDLESIMISEFSFAPNDAHQLIKKNVNFVLDRKGGDGFIRNFFEIILEFDRMSTEELLEIL